MATATRILGLDPGLRRTGWGIVEYSGNRFRFVDAGDIAPDSKLPLPLRLSYIYTHLSDILSSHSPGEVSIETLFVHKNVSSAMRLCEARSVCLLAPSLLEIPIFEYAPTKVKKSLVGFGHSGKFQVGRMVRVLLPDAHWKHDDTADALALAICHAHHR